MALRLDARDHLQMPDRLDNVICVELPEAVLRKSKHGFGVPVGIWVNRDPALRERVCSRLDALARRGIVRREIIAQLLQLQSADPASYYGALLWPLFALEEWLQANRL